MIRDLKLLIKRNKIYNNYFSKKMSLGSKRLDICSAQFAHCFGLSKKQSLSDKVCLEIGGGWLLSHALVLYLLGAKKVYVADFNVLANPKYLHSAINNSITSIVRDVLSPFDDHDKIRFRLDKLLSIKKFDFNVLKDLGIEYIAPIDLAKEKTNLKVDFIYSNSVLEHVPVNDIKPLLDNLVSDLNPNGYMIHCIHLEDHINGSNPFDFFTIPKDKFDPYLQTFRGNRVRCSEWENIFSNITNTDTKLIYKWLRKDVDLPDNICQSLIKFDEDDIRTSHIGVCTIKF
ncbi:MAG: hypothetical protein CMJ05_01520 [Pelagibacterales bacterium]|nr:hypothetical protein [Pelagibacterales bacterium]|tara:strand:- start:17995 stop:18855 length:861 start_codon:yes stop_codon:yes gene_type:complete